MREVLNVWCVLGDNYGSDSRTGEPEEGLTAMFVVDRWMPLTVGHEDNVANVRKMGQMLADQTGKVLKLVKFTRVEVVDVIKPKGAE